jgi:hypothetical protein
MANETTPNHGSCDFEIDGISLVETESGFLLSATVLPIAAGSM